NRTLVVRSLRGALRRDTEASLLGRLAHRLVPDLAPPHVHWSVAARDATFRRVPGALNTLCARAGSDAAADGGGGGGALPETSFGCLFEELSTCREEEVWQERCEPPHQVRRVREGALYVPHDAPERVLVFDVPQSAWRWEGARGAAAEGPECVLHGRCRLCALAHRLSPRERAAARAEGAAASRSIAGSLGGVATLERLPLSDATSHLEWRASLYSYVFNVRPHFLAARRAAFARLGWPRAAGHEAPLIGDASTGSSDEGGEYAFSTRCVSGHVRRGDKLVLEAPHVELERYVEEADVLARALEREGGGAALPEEATLPEEAARP